MKNFQVKPQKRWHHNHNNKKWLKQPESHFHEALPHKNQLPCSFDVFSVRPPQMFHIQTEISTIRPVFQDYFSVTYDYI